MAREPTRAQDAGVSMKRLRRMAELRINRMHGAAMAIRQAWSQLDDSQVDAAYDEIEGAICNLRQTLCEIAEYQELPVGKDVG